jgi:predicted DNA-binding protein YlxM (UPF0122 family)
MTYSQIVTQILSINQISGKFNSLMTYKIKNYVECFYVDNLCINQSDKFKCGYKILVCS